MTVRIAMQRDADGDITGTMLALTLHQQHPVTGFTAHPDGITCSLTYGDGRRATGVADRGFLLLEDDVR